MENEKVLPILSANEAGRIIAEQSNFEGALTLIDKKYGARVAAEIERFNEKDHEEIARLLISKDYGLYVAKYLVNFRLRNPIDVLRLLVTHRTANVEDEKQTLIQICENFEDYLSFSYNKDLPFLNAHDAKEIKKLIFDRIDELGVDSLLLMRARVIGAIRRN